MTEILPLITEKAQRLKEKNQYFFRVPKSANKTEVKKAIEKRFKVKIKSIRILNVKGKPKRWGRIPGKTKSYKKAIVTLKEGKIEL